MEEALSEVPLLACLPFLIMLLAIAALPLSAPRFWENNKNKLLVALVLSAPVVVYFAARRETALIRETLIFDYLPFIVLLGALYTIAGGIHLAGDIEATPRVNALFLGIGAVLASFIGTTGAAMLLIRPVLRTNQERRFKTHTVLFFIAIVANCGGLLTPLGDPPLFMMYLRGAPFGWFFGFLSQWLFVNGLLLLVYFGVDAYYHGKEPAESLQRDRAERRPLRIQGASNFAWLLGVIGAVAFLNEQYVPGTGSHSPLRFLREAAIVLMAAASWLSTKKIVRHYNRFTWHSFHEVAYLFLGIFITMVPCIAYLQANAKTLGVRLPSQFYYAVGALSSFLDNTPAAVTFHSLALGLGQSSGRLVAGIPEALLQAICLSSVFFGSMTYIGNGPNFMVKAIAEDHHVRMPHFFGYLVKFSLLVLFPIFVLVQLLFI
ncbi:MAG: sodium:proton antiporter [Candidatus Aminicenantes bacterium RBG_16_63_16]|nr:MAG: sodium:proton antiporter [Candidatus Aminicenantes bacterium RBG_16_63_16]